MTTIIDLQTAALFGFATGLGVETAKIIHELWIRPRIEAASKKLKKLKEIEVEL